MTQIFVLTGTGLLAEIASNDTGGQFPPLARTLIASPFAKRFAELIGIKGLGDDLAGWIEQPASRNARNIYPLSRLRERAGVRAHHIVARNRSSIQFRPFKEGLLRFVEGHQQDETWS
jgi:hypothetical protein